MEPTAEFAQLQLGFVDRTQWRYEVIRPLVLCTDRTAQQRAQETHTHPDTVRTLQRRFRRQGMRGLLPADVEVVPRRRASPIPEAVRQEIDRLKALYDGFHDRELARIRFITFGAPIDHKTVKTLWQASPVACQGHLALWDSHAQPDRYQARLQVIQLYDRGWDKVGISRFLHVSRPTVDAWIQRFETEHFAGLVDLSRGPHAPACKVWLPLMVLYTACLRYGVPNTLISDSGGAYTSNAFEEVCARLQLSHETIESTKGESYHNVVETPFNIQRWLYDYQFALARTPAELEQRHQAFIQTYNTTAASEGYTSLSGSPIF